MTKSATMVAWRASEARDDGFDRAINQERRHDAAAAETTGLLRAAVTRLTLDCSAEPGAAQKYRWNFRLGETIPRASHRRPGAGQRAPACLRRRRGDVLKVPSSRRCRAWANRRAAFSRRAVQPLAGRRAGRPRQSCCRRFGSRDSDERRAEVTIGRNRRRRASDLRAGRSGTWRRCQRRPAHGCRRRRRAAPELRRGAASEPRRSAAPERAGSPPSSADCAPARSRAARPTRDSACCRRR